jgi:hypothetical protein
LVTIGQNVNLIATARGSRYYLVGYSALPYNKPDSINEIISIDDPTNIIPAPE